MNKKSLNFLVNEAMREDSRLHMRPVVVKELLHYDILFALEKSGLLDQLTFQGGTALHLCYGASRFSEDLDFVGGREFIAADLEEIKNCIEIYIGERYDVEIFVKQPKDLLKSAQKDSVRVSKWQIQIVTEPARKDVPRQMIKLDVANIPAYTRAPLSLKYNYSFLPDGYKDMLIMTETLDEIMADKVVLLVASQKYIRHRDIWDLRWLKQQGAVLQIELVEKKIDDYQVDHYLEKLEVFLEHLHEIVHGSEFLAQMQRFIPVDVQERTLKKEKFLIFLSNEIAQLLSEVKSKLLCV